MRGDGCWPVAAIEHYALDKPQRTRRLACNLNRLGYFLSRSHSQSL